MAANPGSASRSGTDPTWSVVNARVYSMQSHERASTRHPLEPDTDAFTIVGGRIAALGSAAPDAPRIDLGGRVVLPGFVDCHTHALFAGNRQDEFAARLAGESYEAIAQRGGGIRATVSALRSTPDAELIDTTVRRLRAMVREGVTTIEIKSGYGLDVAEELRMLRLIRAAGERMPVHLEPTCLAAHSFPADRSRAAWMADILDRILPAVAAERLARTVDVYIESVAFDLAEARRIFERARELGLGIRAHTEQFSNLGGTLAACELGALSCDHLEHAGDREARAMAAAGTVAVLLPGAYYCLRETHLPPVDALRAAGAAIAIATDFNPGTSPVASLLTALHQSVVLFGLSPAEALAGVTCHAARALGLQADIGTLGPGKLANFTVWDLPDPGYLAYQLGGLAPETIYVRGRAQ
jgi:imidazolonepropionase